MCVVSDGGALPENVLHKQTGWVVEKRRPQLLAQTIMEVSSLTDEAQATVRIQAQKRIRNHFNIVSQTKAFEAFYDTGNL
jgi:colanic acid/amylovoran biosynthesis glycosyltransferase